MLNRFFSETIPSEGEIALITGDEAHHASRVSRVRPGEHVEVIDPSGAIAEAIVETIGEDRVSARIVASLSSREPALSITLALGLIKPDLVELVLQKGTELGVAGFQPMVTDRTEIRSERVKGKRERWERILREAVKQSGRSLVPQIEEVASLDEVVSRGGDLIRFDAAASGDPSCKPVAPVLLIGPEGGWSEREADMMSDAGIPAVRLGPRRLRAETAALAAVTWAQISFGDF